MEFAQEERVFVLPPTDAPLPWTGERFIPGLEGEIAYEHLHRYLFALQFCDAQDVLDVACGEGYGSHLLGQVARSVIGVDVDREIIEHATRRYGSRSVAFRPGRCDALPLADETVDTVISFETIEHIEEQDAFLGEVCRVLRPGGVLVISTPERNEYNSAGTERNPFHHVELTRQDLVAICARHFRYYELGAEKALMGAVIQPDAGNSEPQSHLHEYFGMADAGTFVRVRSVSGARYLLAVASDAPIAAVRWGVFDDTQGFSRQSAALTAALAERQQQSEDLATLRAAQAELKAQLGAADRRNEEQVAVIASLQAALTQQLQSLLEARQASERVQRGLARELAEQQSTVLRSTLDRDAAREQVRVLTAELGNSRLTIEDLLQELQGIRTSGSYRSLEVARRFAHRYAPPQSGRGRVLSLSSRSLAYLLTAGPRRFLIRLVQPWRWHGAR